jgi:putative phosphoserine phosphatase/1-acylglycerol-3-phosphate O-acyltransferase
VAEVDAGPPGPRVGAFFDLDGTLVAGYTAAAQTRYRLRRGDLRVVEFLAVAQLAVQFRLGRRAFETLIEGSARTIRGRLARDVEETGERIFQRSVADLIYPEMRELVRAHQRRGHTVVLSSSALTNQVAPVARYLGIEHIVCNRLMADEHGVLTGEIEPPVIWGPTKASGVQAFAAGHGVDLGASYFYADGDEDLSLMRLVGHPRPTNPGPMLTKAAERNGWPVMRFSSRGSGGPLGMARRLASVGSLGPLAAAALGVGLVRRNKRAGINFLTRFWPRTILALSGVKLNVTGAEHLTERRPAVFLFNLRGNFDVLLVAALVKENWTGVATKELRGSRVLGPLGNLLGVTFVDREDEGGAADLTSLVVAARKGLSILIAPEGTRLDTQSVGPFQSRAFRIAMAAGLPIVSIVIRNSESVAGRNAVRLHPGTVDIAVLPPVSVENWTPEDLGERLEQIRTAYVETLARPASLQEGLTGGGNPHGPVRSGAGPRSARQPRGRPSGRAAERFRWRSAAAAPTPQGIGQCAPYRARPGAGRAFRREPRGPRAANSDDCRADVVLPGQAHSAAPSRPRIPLPAAIAPGLSRPSGAPRLHRRHVVTRRMRRTSPYSMRYQVFSQNRPTASRAGRRT